MEILHNAPIGRKTQQTGKGFFRVGAAFAALGVLAIMAPVWATITAELLVAWILFFWGIVGVGFALSMRPAQEWVYAAGLFCVVLLLGLVFLVFPGVGVSTLTVILMLIFLVEGAVSIILGLRLSGALKNWGWMVFSGVCALGVGLVILFGWPESIAGLVLGLLMGLNFLSTGLTMILLSRTAQALSAE